MRILYLIYIFSCLAAPALAQTVAAPQQQNSGARPPVSGPYVVSPLQGLSNILNYGNTPPQQPQTVRPAYGLPTAIPPNTTP